jgi:trimethylamine--corrinoid protein Co-methyltransferase
LDVIAEVGPGRDFLMHEHTFARMRSQSKTQIFDRRAREAWIEATDGKTTAEVATEKAMEIINNHQPSLLPPGAEETMDVMVGEFEARLRSECGG